MENFMDEPIPDSVTNLSLPALTPHSVPSKRERKVEKRKALSQTFDPLHAVTKRKIGLSHRDLLPLVAANQSLTTPPPLILLKEAGIVRAYSAILPVGHCVEADAMTFTATMKPETTTLIETELDRVGGVKFTLVLTAELEKPTLGHEQDNDETKPDTMTTAYFRSDAAPILNSGEIQQKVDEAVAKILKKLEDFTNSRFRMATKALYSIRPGNRAVPSISRAELYQDTGSYSTACSNQCEEPGQPLL